MSKSAEKNLFVAENLVTQKESKTRRLPLPPQCQRHLSADSPLVERDLVSQYIINVGLENESIQNQKFSAFFERLLFSFAIWLLTATALLFFYSYSFFVSVPIIFEVKN